MPGIERDGWFVSTGQVGPISSAALERLVSTGEVRLTTLVWHESLKHWTTLQSVLSINAPWELEVAGPTARLDPVGPSKAIRAPGPQPICGPLPTPFSSQPVPPGQSKSKQLSVPNLAGCSGRRAKCCRKRRVRRGSAHREKASPPERGTRSAAL